MQNQKKISVENPSNFFIFSLESFFLHFRFHLSLDQVRQPLILMILMMSTQCLPHPLHLLSLYQQLKGVRTPVTTHVPYPILVVLTLYAQHACLILSVPVLQDLAAFLGMVFLILHMDVFELQPNVAWIRTLQTPLVQMISHVSENCVCLIAPQIANVLLVSLESLNKLEFHFFCLIGGLS